MVSAIDKDLYRKKFDSLGCCIIVPTYNNEATLGEIVKDLLSYTDHIIVVNDGSTDQSVEILNQYPFISVISYQPNRGKGSALRVGLKSASERNYNYAITIDSDGQHFPADLPLFLDQIEKTPGALLVGSRNLDQENMPVKNSFGNKFSNFWFRFETGTRLPDTQSGYRLYPLQKIKGIHLFTKRYEFELEILVKSAWNNISIIPVPIHVYYAPGGKQVSHFRPGTDFFRISLLNTWFVIQTIFWYKPRRLVKKLSREHMKAFLKTHFLDLNESAIKKSLSVAFGVFMGIVPIWGYQFVSALILAHFLKLNKVIVGLAANISIPPMIPLLLYGSLKTGQWILNSDSPEMLFSRHLSLETVKLHLIEYIVGSIVFAIIMAVIFGVMTYLILKGIESKIKADQ